MSERLAVLAVAGLLLSGCGGEEMQATTPQETRPAPAASTTETAPTTETQAPPDEKAEALPGLPAWTAGYRDWTRLNSEPLPPRDSDPHLGTKNVFVTEPSREGAFPVGTVVVKEAFRPGKDFVGLIATMRKIEGANPEHNDWVFVEWARDAAGEPFTELASGAVCSSCHVGAEEKDYVFTSP